MKARAVCCGIFTKEMELLEPGLRSRIEPRFLDSMLHIRPARLEETLSAALSEPPLGPIVVVYGDCCPHMRELVSLPGVAKTEGVNCIEIALGSERFRALRREGAFFFMPEWLERWKEVFSLELGFEDGELAKDFMRESAKAIVYVDTGCAGIPSAALEDIGRYFGLPVRVETALSGFLEAALEKALEGLEDDR